MSALRDKFSNKDTAFTDEEREKLHLVGRLPFRVESAEQQVARCRFQLEKLGSDIEKWMYLTRLQETNATLFYHLCMSDLATFLPLVYTPTVGTACSTYSEIWQGLPAGFYLRREFSGRIREILSAWPETPEVIVATDGTRILGLGDLGTGGHQICVGKLTLYSLGGGFNPRKVLPISFDFGAAVDAIRESPYYLGKPEPRDKQGLPELVAETVAAVRSLWPRCIFQFEDFSNDTAFSLLAANRHKGPIFNDDVQGTGVIAAATVAAGIRASNIKHGEHKTPADQVYLLYGAGAGGIGVADSICMLSVAEGKTLEEARAQFYVMDSKGLITSDREDFRAGKLQPHKLAFVRKDLGIEGHRTLEETVRAVKPTCIIGMSITPGAFSPAVLEAISSDPAVTPIILALSNPTAKCECTSQQAYDACRGNCFYASGSPMGEVHYGGKTYTTAQCNNFYVFPGIGLGAYVAQVPEITDEMFAAVAQGVANSVPEESLARGYLLPRLEDIREISVNCALNICRVAEKQGKCGAQLPAGDEELREVIRGYQWKGDY